VSGGIVSVGGSIVTDMGYFAGGGGVAKGEENYYTKGAGDASADRNGIWNGKLAETWGLAGKEVEGDQLETIYGKWVAPDGTKLGRQAPSAGGVFRPIGEQLDEWKAAHPGALPEAIVEAKKSIESKARDANLGIDLTFSVPKSWTIEHTAAWREEIEAESRGDLDEAARFKSIRVGIEEAIESANEAFMKAVEATATSQVGHHGGIGVAGRWQKVEKLAYTSFFQFTSRAIQPQLHIHNPIVNRVVCEDGQIRSVDTDDLLAHRHMFSAIADRVGAEKLAEMGFEMEMRLDDRERPAWEDKSVSREMVETVSERRMVIRGKFKEQLAEAEASAGRELTDPERWRLKQAITKQTRQRKSTAVPVPKLLERVQEQIQAKLATGLGPIAARARVAVEARDRARERGESIATGTWSERDVLQRSVDQVTERQATWTRDDLLYQIQENLPILGVTDGDRITAILNRLTDKALQDVGLVTQTSGREGIDVPLELGGAGTYVKPTEQRYSSTGSLAAERALREAAEVNNRHRVPARHMEEWLDRHDRYRTAGADQRAAAVGLMSSGRSIATFEAPAGTGKSFTLGAVAEAWEDLSGGGRVHGLAPSERAAQVLEDDGVKVTANTAKWLAAQERIAGGKALQGDLPFRVNFRDVVVIDEASMVSTEDIKAVRKIVEAKGARLVLSGDQEQLSSVEAGGVLGILDGYAETYRLTDVRRFAAEWEAAASLRLRAGDVSVLDEYERRGRIVDCESEVAAIDQAARDAFADMLDTSDYVRSDGKVVERPDGREVMVVTRTNQQAAAASAAIREWLVAAGRVQEAGVELEEHGGIAGKGDRVACRENNFRLGVTNRRLYTVHEVHADGGISVVSHRTQEIHELPAWYVSKHVASGYAGTANAVQGISIDRTRDVFDGSENRAGAYVPLTRGAELNVAYVAVAKKDEDPSKARVEKEYQAAGGGEARHRVHEFDGSKERPTGRAVLADCLKRDGANQDAAIVMLDRDDERLRNMAWLHGLREDAVERSCVARTVGWFGELATLGVLDEADHARLISDQGTTQLSNLLRTIEQEGHDPKASLAHAVMDGRGFLTKSGEPVKSIAMVLQARISQTYEEATGAKPGVAVPSEARMPAGLSEDMERYLRQIDEAQDNRRRELGTQVAEEAPAWAVSRLGPVPAEPTERLEWEHKAGVAAGYRESRGWTDARRAVDNTPGISTPERRAAWHQAADAIGYSEDSREEAGMSEGQLRNRIAAFRNEQKWAPAHADEALKSASREVDEARTEALLAKDASDAEFWRKEEANRRDDAEVLGRTAEARDAWSEETAAAYALYKRAVDELKERGLPPVGQEPDRMTTAEWMASQTDEVEDPEEVAEVDIRDEVRDREIAAGFEERSGDLAMVETVGPERRDQAAYEYAPAYPTEEERIELDDRAVAVADLIADRRSQEESVDLSEVDAYEPVEVPQQREQVAEIGEMSVER
jgi:hypothetical protein